MAIRAMCKYFTLLTHLVQVIVPETALVYPIGDHEYHDLIMLMVCNTLEESQDNNPNDSIVTWMRLNISPPEEYSGSSDLEVYKMFVAGILQWLRLHGLLGVNYTETQVQFLGTWLKGNASEWFNIVENVILQTSSGLMLGSEVSSCYIMYCVLIWERCYIFPCIFILLSQIKHSA